MRLAGRLSSLFAAGKTDATDDQDFLFLALATGLQQGMPEASVVSGFGCCGFKAAQPTPFDSIHVTFSWT
jgi:hypothetical protein